MRSDSKRLGGLRRLAFGANLSIALADLRAAGRLAGGVEGIAITGGGARTVLHVPTTLSTKL
jgi:hypothetical protein